MSTTQQVEIVSIKKTAIWVEDDLLGARHVMVQHEGCEPFTYATFNYHHHYTSNGLTFRSADALALQLGAVEPVEHKTRPMSAPTLPPVAQPLTEADALSERAIAQAINNAVWVDGPGADKDGRLHSVCRNLWAQWCAQHVAQPARPSWSDQLAFEAFARKEGLILTRVNQDELCTRGGLAPAYYIEDMTECAWRAWANKPAHPADFPPRIMALLTEVADRNPGPHQCPWEDAQGEPMQDDADAAIAWINAMLAAAPQPKEPA